MVLSKPDNKPVQYRLQVEGGWNYRFWKGYENFVVSNKDVSKVVIPMVSGFSVHFFAIKATQGRQVSGFND
jgi:hypothetical protein